MYTGSAGVRFRTRKDLQTSTVQRLVMIQH